MNGQKRAEVWRARYEQLWFVDIFTRPRDRTRPIVSRSLAGQVDHAVRDTHADALAWAIEQTHDTTGEQA